MPPDPVKCSCQDFGLLGQYFVFMWMLISHKSLRLFQNNWHYDTSNVRLEEYFIDV